MSTCVWTYKYEARIDKEIYNETGKKYNMLHVLGPAFRFTNSNCVWMSTCKRGNACESFYDVHVCMYRTYIYIWIEQR